MVGIPVTKEKRAKIPDDFPLWRGKIDCVTCHDINRQCEKRLFEKVTLRGAPYPIRTLFCFKCHDSKDYDMLNPHNQLADDGTPKVKICLYCHTEKPDETRDRYEDIRLVGDIVPLCQRCHFIKYNHSGNFNHMVKPSEKALARMETMRTKFDIVLPLDRDGKLTCVTCHNSHQRGVIPENRPGAKGADSVFRHRIPGFLCLECHQK